ncbi:ubiquitin-specific protease otu1, partial [Ascosphaera atra]
MRLRIRGPSGQATVTLDNTSPIESLKAHITEKTGLSSYTVKYGYPPKPLDLTTVSPSDPVSSIGIADGEQLTVAASETPPQQPLSSQHAAAPSVAAEPAAPPRQKQKDVSADPPEVPSEEHAGTVVLRVMPDDNSCLFRAVGTAVMGAMDTMTELRSAVAQAIQSQPDRFTAAILGKDPDDY